MDKLCPQSHLMMTCAKQQCQCWIGDSKGECSFKVIAKSLQQIASKLSLGDTRHP